jgi:hypothetical protein
MIHTSRRDGKGRRNEDRSDEREKKTERSKQTRKREIKLERRKE